MVGFSRVCAVVLALGMASASASSLRAPMADEGVIRVLPGPLNGATLQTPWGNYVVDRIGSDAVWVGTEDEYERARQAAISRSLGEEEVKLNGFSPDGVGLVSAKATRLRFGTTHIYNIDTEIMFGAKPLPKYHRPAKPAGTEYVSVGWVQGGPASVRAVMSVSGKAIEPSSCVVNHGFYSCEFIMTREALSVPGLIVFYAKGERPGVLSFTSVAQRAYQDMVFWSKDEKLQLDREEQADVGKLHDLDASVPAGRPKELAGFPPVPDYCHDPKYKVSTAWVGKGKRKKKVEYITDPDGWTTAGTPMCED